MRATVRRAAHRTVKQASALYDQIRPPEPGVVVLAYHRVGGGSSMELDLDPAVFDEQMSHLGRSGRVLDLDRAVDDLVAATPQPDGEPPVVITFDDGTADFMEHALPALVEHRVHATYYIATRFIDEQTSFPDAGTPLTWEAMREAASTGFVTFGSHTHSHTVMDKLIPAEAEEELRRSAERLAEELGSPAEHFAYPKGVFGGEDTERLIGRHFRTAALADGGVNPFSATDPLRIDRIPIQRSDGMAFFRRKIDGGMRLEGQARQVLNARRYRSARN